MSGIKGNSHLGKGELKISSSTTTYLTLGYTGSSQLDFNLPISYGSEGQVLRTDGTGGLSWATVGGGGGGTNGTSGSSGTNGSSGTTPPSNTTAFWFGQYTSTQVLGTGSVLIGLTVSNEVNMTGSTAAVFDFDGTYYVDYAITFGEKSSGGYGFDKIMLYFLKYNGATVSSSVELLAIDKHATDPTGTVGLSSYNGSTIISATANSTLEFWAKTPFLIFLRPDGTEPGYTAKMSIFRIAD
jgi:hypothetical protein